MAATDARPVVLKNTALRVYFPVIGSDGRLVTGVTFGQSRSSKDGGGFANTTNAPTELGEGWYYIDITSTEINSDGTVVHCPHTTDGAPDVTFVLYPKDTGDVSVSLEANQDVRNVSGTVASVTALASGAITATSINSNTQTGFIAIIDFKKDNAQSRDEYTVQFVNIQTGAPLAAASITGTPTITVANRDGGSPFINAQSLTAGVDTYTWNYNATGGARITSGSTGVVSFGITHATLGALTMKREFVGRDA